MLNGSQGKGQMLLRGKIIFSLRENFTKGLMQSGPQEKDLKLSEEMTIFTLMVNLLKDQTQFGHLGREQVSLKEMIICSQRETSQRDLMLDGSQGKGQML